LTCLAQTVGSVSDAGSWMVAAVLTVLFFGASCLGSAEQRGKDAVLMRHPAGGCRLQARLGGGWGGAFTMAAVTEGKRCRGAKPARFVRLALAPHQGNPGIVRITAGNVITDYRVWPLASDFGIAFALEKFGGGERYHVLLDPSGGKHSCECKGWLRW